eukprot:293711_1
MGSSLSIVTTTLAIVQVVLSGECIGPPSDFKAAECDVIKTEEECRKHNVKGEGNCRWVKSVPESLNSNIHSTVHGMQKTKTQVSAPKQTKLQSKPADSELGDITGWKDYIRWIKSNAVQQTNVNTQIPDELLEPLFAFNFRKEQNGYPDVKGTYVTRKDFLNTPVQFRLTFHEKLDNTLVIFFLGADLSYIMPTVAQKMDNRHVETVGYLKVPIFSFIDQQKDAIIHAGIMDILLDKYFNIFFVNAMDEMRGKLMGMGADIDRIIISGHSMGGGVAQAFFLLLHADAKLMTDAVKSVRKIMEKWKGTPIENKVTDNMYDHHITKKKSIMRKCVINSANKHKLFVITTGALLILANKNNGVTDRQPLIFATDRIFNFIKKGDPAPQIFGGDKKYVIVQRTDKVKTKRYPVGNSNTATYMGNYYIVKTEKEEQTISPFTLKVYPIDIIRLIDGNTIIPNSNTNYLTQHLSYENSPYFFEFVVNMNRFHGKKYDKDFDTWCWTEQRLRKKKSTNDLLNAMGEKMKRSIENNKRTLEIGGKKVTISNVSLFPTMDVLQLNIIFLILIGVGICVFCMCGCGILGYVIGYLFSSSVEWRNYVKLNGMKNVEEVKV